jgi:hypothetical protein
VKIDKLRKIPGARILTFSLAFEKPGSRITPHELFFERFAKAFSLRLAINWMVY